ncbi:MAG: sigma-70 family RNA polymerase sigma factor [Bacteroidota bacterium]|mgnify:CR=1 FL=1
MKTTSLFEQEALPQLQALHSYARLLCRDDHYSRDLVQETMLKAYIYFHTYRKGTNCRAWLFQICKNSYINEVRRRKLQPVAVDFQEEESGERSRVNYDVERELHVSFSEYHSEMMEPGVLSDEVETAFEALPSDYQTVLILCDMEGCTYNEIAEFMQVPVGTIRSRIHRGRKMMAERLEGYARSQGYVSHIRSTSN